MKHVQQPQQEIKDIHMGLLRFLCLLLHLFFRCITAASRRSLDRVSVPMWGTFLSEPLLIVALVGRYPANKLIRRIPIHHR